MEIRADAEAALTLNSQTLNSVCMCFCYFVHQLLVPCDNRTASEVTYVHDPGHHTQIYSFISAEQMLTANSNTKADIQIIAGGWSLIKAE